MKNIKLISCLAISFMANIAQATPDTQGEGDLHVKIEEVKPTLSHTCSIYRNNESTTPILTDSCNVKIDNIDDKETIEIDMDNRKIKTDRYGFDYIRDKDKIARKLADEMKDIAVGDFYTPASICYSNPEGYDICLDNK